MDTRDCISALLEPELVAFLEGGTREEVIRTLVDLLERQGKLRDAATFHIAILQREKLVSTGIGMGVAIPHAKLPGYEQFFMAIGIHRKGVQWDALDHGLVRLIFMIGGPDNQQTEYLRLLSQLTSVVREEEVRKKMLQLNDAQAIIELFRGGTHGS